MLCLVTHHAVRHTGTGRISRLRMRTMTLFESLESSGDISLKALFDGCCDGDGMSTFKDDNGKPGERNTRKDKTPPSSFKCPSCKSPLFRRKGVSTKTGKEYDFYYCPNKACNKTFNTVDDKPDFSKSKK
jgi:hypothetical protein